MADSYAEEGGRDPRGQHIVKRLNVIRDHAAQLKEATGVVADKIVGSQGPSTLNGSGQTSAPKAAGFFAEIDDLISSIQSTLAVASDNIRRFEREF